MFDFGGVYISLSDYSRHLVTQSVNSEDSEALLTLLAADAPYEEMIFGLAALSHFAHYPEQGAPAIQTLRSALRQEVRQHLDELLQHRQAFARQPVLRAMREVLRYPDRVPMGRFPPGIAQILLVHAAGDSLNSAPRASEDKIGDMPSDIVIDLVANWVFHESDDRWSLMTRVATLWRRFGHLAGEYLDGRNAVDLLTDATGLEPEDMLALGFILSGYSMLWTPAKPQLLRLDEGIGIDPSKVEAFARCVCATPEEMALKVQSDSSSTWDYLAFEKTPVLRLPNGYLVLDESLLWERVTNGLYWFVHDYLKVSEGESSRKAWTQAWGDIVETAVGDILEHCIIASLDGSALIWSEDDFHEAYGDDKKSADFILDCGDKLLLFEVVSGQVKTGTRIDLGREAFDQDIEKLVMKKVRQLHSTAIMLLTDEAPLTGISPVSQRQIIPIVVAAMGFPYIEPVIKHVRDLMKSERLLENPLIKGLCILDFRELELIEAKAESGIDPATALLEWFEGTDALVSFWNWSITRANGRPLRPTRVSGEGIFVANELRRRIRVADDPDPDIPWHPDPPR